MWKYLIAKNTRHYLDVLPQLVSSNNSTYHMSIKMAPNQVSLLNVGLVRRNLSGNVKSKVEFKFPVGDRVRISKNQRTFKKGYLPNWTEEIFTISKRITKECPSYKLTDNSEEILEGSFYEEELQKVIKEDNIFRIESILSKRERRDTLLLVKWKG